MEKNLEKTLIWICGHQRAWTPLNKNTYCTAENPNCEYYKSKDRKCKKDTRQLTKELLKYGSYSPC